MNKPTAPRLTIDSKGRLAYVLGDTTVPVVRGGDGEATPPAQLPEDLAGRIAGIAELPDEDLGALEADLQAHLEEVTAVDDVTDEVIAQASAARDAIRQVWADAERRYTEAATAEEEAERRRAELEAIVAEVNPEGDETPEGDEPETADGDTPPNAGDNPEVTTEPEGEAQPEPVAAATRQRPPIGAVRSRRRPAPRTPASAETRARTTLVAAAPWGNRFQAGQELRSIGEVGEAFAAAAHSLRNVTGNDGQQVPVVRLQVEYPEERRLTRGDVEGNSRKLDDVTRPQAIAAAGGLCAPLMPDYTVPQISDASRRLPGALARMGAERGGIRWVPAPSFGDYSTGVDIWTAANDENPTDPTTKPCAVVDCDDEASVTVDAITKCLEVGNFIARTYDERVQAIVELLDAFWARTAESTHLTAIGAQSTQVAVGQGLGATRDILARLDLATAAERDRYRMSDSEPIRVMFHRMVRNMIRADLAREIPGSTQERLATADNEIDAFFAARDLNPTWLMDGEAGAVFGAQGNGDLVGWPTSIVGHFFHEGAWAFLDGGTLDLGIVRDSTLNETNDFRIFAESWEAVAKKGIWSRRLAFDVCPSGWSSAPIDYDPCAQGS